MNIKEINLEILIRDYRENESATKGFEILKTLINTDDQKNITKLLRNEVESPIKLDKEFKDRHNINSLFKYYNNVVIGIIADCLPNPLPTKIEKELLFILTDPYVNRYFTDYNPILLPQLLVKQIIQDVHKEYFNHKSIETASPLFDRFLILNQSVENDEDTNQFLWFLDDRSKDGYSISDFWEVLKDRDKIKKELKNETNNPLSSALWGFIDYTQFLSNYADLLRDTEGDPILQSSFWHYQSYWFKQKNNCIKDIVKFGLKNLRDIIKVQNDDEIFNDKGTSHNSKDEAEIEGLENDINYLLNQQLGDPFNDFYRQS